MKEYKATITGWDSNTDKFIVSYQDLDGALKEIEIDGFFVAAFIIGEFGEPEEFIGKVF